MMKQLSILSSAVAAALFSQSTMAAVITGQVLDKNQQPISNAEIHVHGKSQSVVTDTQGQFKIDVDNKGQLHISKDNYIDKRVAINGENQNLVVTLTPTSVETVVVYASALHKNSLEMISQLVCLIGQENYTYNFNPFKIRTFFLENILLKFINMFIAENFICTH